MPNEVSVTNVEREARSISRRAFSGIRSSVYQKEKHLVNCAESIRKRWNVSPKHWKAKHIRWFFEVSLADRSSGTKYRYYRYVRAVLIEMDRWDDIESFLHGYWVRP